MRVAVVLLLGLLGAGGSGCSRALDVARGSLEKIHLPSIRARKLGSSRSSRAGERIVRRAIEAYGGRRYWERLEGVELKMVWKEYVGGQVDENPALVQLRPGSPPQLRIHFEKLDHVYGLGDQDAWVTIRGEPDRNPDFVAQAKYTCTVLSFLLSLPFNLTDPGLIIRSAESRPFAGAIYDVVTIGFTGAGYPWPDDTLQLWLHQANARLDRCFLISTAESSGFGPPPNYILIQWSNHSQEAGVPLPRTWSYFRAEPDGTLKEKMFDIEVESALGNRSFMPVLFRLPEVAPPPVRRTTPAVGPQPAPARP